MTSNRQITVALLHALLSGKPDVVEHVQGFATVLQDVLASTIAPEGANAEVREVCELLQCIWFTALIGWATGVASDDHIGVVMRKAARRLLKAD